MDKRRLLGKGEEWLGVEWRNNKGKIVLFSFTHFNYNLPKGSKVRDITMDKPIEVKRELSTQPYHTYLIKAPRL